MLEKVAEIFARYQAGLAHAGDYDSALAGEEEIDGFLEGFVEASEDILDGLGFDLEDATGGFEAHAEVARDSLVVERDFVGRLWRS